MSERYKEEIEDILRQVGDSSSSSNRRFYGERFFKFALMRISQSLQGGAWSLRPGRVMLLSVVVFVSAVIAGVFSSGLGAPLGWIGFVLFVAAYVMFLSRSPKVDYEKRWRGRTMEYVSKSWWDRVRRLIK